jgi:thiol:disulfide interchange protein DsbC|tara:strand:+ start:154 stop:921 length:768 start_codon:yes stop_codon:yes gene_type:complete
LGEEITMLYKLVRYGLAGLNVNNSILLIACSLICLSVSADEGIQEIERAFHSMTPIIKPSTIEKSPIKDVYLVTVGENAFYVTKRDGFLIMGNIYDLDRNVYLLTERWNKLIKEAIDTMPLNKMLVISPAKAKRFVTVFTDVDCVFCRRFHEEVGQLNRAGLEVRYLLYPGAGVQSESYKRLVSVWCADDQLQALTDAKQGKSLPSKNCDNPVAAHFRLGQDIGLKGTPWIVLDNGKVISHYVAVSELLEEVGLN